MTDSTARYHAISSSDSGDPDAHEAGVTSDNSCPSGGWFSVEAGTRWTYFLLGCATLLPWNALLNGTPFFRSRLAGSVFQPILSPYLSSVYTLVNLICQFYSTVTSKRSSSSRRIFASIVGMVLLVISLCFSTFIQGTPLAFFSFTLLIAAISAVTSAYLGTAVFAGAALFGASFLQTVLSGQAAVAVAVSVVQVVSSIISLWNSSPESDPGEVSTATGGNSAPPEDMAARIFFGVSAIFLGITVAAYVWLTRQPVHKSVTGVLERYRDAGDTNEFTALVADNHRNPLANPDSRVYHVFKRNLIFMFSIAYVFAVTLAVYPATTVRVQSVNPGTHSLLFTAVHFLFFSTGDLAGRYSCSFPRLLIRSAKKILVMSLLRTLFIPMFLLCNVRGPSTPRSFTPIINSDIPFLVIMLTLGYTNGLFSTQAMLVVSSLEHNPRLEGRHEDVDVAATLGGFFVIVGLAAGALVSFAVQVVI